MSWPSDLGGRARHGAGSSADVLGFSDAAFMLLRDLIAQQVGLHYSDEKRDLLADKLADLVAAQGMMSFLDYYYLLRYDADAARHWDALVDRLAVPETYFWRQKEQIEALASVVAPRHFREHPARPLRIWSAACCTGEEPISLAIALAEAGLLGRAPIELVASDASAALLARAQEGLYGERSFRALPPELRARWFRQEGTRWRVDPSLHRCVRWTRANLVDPMEVRPLAAADVIFCRNVFIYFTDATIEAVARQFAAAQPETGVLFLGASESLTRLDTGYELCELGGAFAYMKPRGTT